MPQAGLCSRVGGDGLDIATLMTALGEDNPTAARTGEEKTRRRMFVLQMCSPALPFNGRIRLDARTIICRRLRCQNNWKTFLVGLAASVGAGIRGFAEALSDDGSLTNRGSPWLRGTICGLMTSLKVLDTRCPTWSLTRGTMPFGLPQVSLAWWSSSSFGPSPSFARDT